MALNSDQYGSITPEYSIETAKANKLDPYGYIEFILDYLPQQDLIEYPEKLDWFLPWSEEIKEEFEIKVD